MKMMMQRSWVVLALAVGCALIGASPFTTTIPQSVNLQFQSGIADDTLVA